MLSVNTEVHLRWKVRAAGLTINTLLPHLRALRQASYQEALATLLERLQEAHLAQVFAAEAELVCTGCGLVHSGSSGLVRRGWRGRRLISREGVLVFQLRQLTCRACGKTFSPYPELLGLAPRQRLLEELVESLISGVLQLSYAKSCALAHEWLGVSCSPRTLHTRVQQKGAALRFTPAPEAGVLLADGTKCPIGSKAQGAEVRLGMQLLGRSEEAGRPRAQLRVVGLGLGTKSWAEALPRTLQPDLVVTDQEPALRAYVREVYPQARHQLCEWHVAYTLDWSLIEDRVPVAKRKRIRALLERILFGRYSRRTKRRHYTRLVRHLGRISPRAQKQLQAAAGLILYEAASAERTTSLLERQMREINRRMENGGRWSESGARHLLSLRLARTHNPDDYARLWNSN